MVPSPRDPLKLGSMKKAIALTVSFLILDILNLHSNSNDAFPDQFFVAEALAAPVVSVHPGGDRGAAERFDRMTRRYGFSLFSSDVERETKKLQLRDTAKRETSRPSVDPNWRHKPRGQGTYKPRTGIDERHEAVPHQNREKATTTKQKIMDALMRHPGGQQSREDFATDANVSAQALYNHDFRALLESENDQRTADARPLVDIRSPRGRPPKRTPYVASLSLPIPPPGIHVERYTGGVSRKVDSPSEWLRVVDPVSGYFLGDRVSRRVAHREGIPHATMHIYFFDDEGRLLLFKRSAKKDLSKGKLQMPSGHFDFTDTIVDLAAKREAEEEVGFKLDSRRLFCLTRINQIHRRSVDPETHTINDERTTVYAYFMSRSEKPRSIKNFNNEEADEILFVWPADFLRWISVSPNDFSNSLQHIVTCERPLFDRMVHDPSFKPAMLRKKSPTAKAA
jgi:8-oxo-dGTP pyrophosphatase MutT (NUDIX family)